MEILHIYIWFKAWIVRHHVEFMSILNKTQLLNSRNQIDSQFLRRMKSVSCLMEILHRFVGKSLLHFILFTYLIWFVLFVSTNSQQPDHRISLDVREDDTFFIGYQQKSEYPPCPWTDKFNGENYVEIYSQFNPN